MPDLKLLQDELSQVNTRQQALREKHKGESVLPPDAREEDAALDERGHKITYLIEEEKQRQRDAQFTERLNYETMPAYKIPFGAHVNDDDDGRKELRSHGWETKDGWIVRQTSNGQLQRMYAESVIFGPLPKDAVLAEYARTARASFQPEYRKSFLSFMAALRGNGSEATALLGLGPDERKALSEGVDSAGGYLVPPDLQAEILVRTAQEAVMRRIATVRQTSRDMYVHNRVEPHATSSSIYSSAFVGTWVGEVPSATETDPVFSRFEIPIKKLRLHTKISNDVLADSISNIPAFLAEDGGRNMALTEDQGFIAGTNPMGPSGIINDSGVTTIDVEGSTTNTISNTTAAAGSSPKLINLAYGVPSQYASRASWIMCRAIEGSIRQLVDFQSRFQWVPTDSAQGQFAPTPTGLLGRPVYNSDFVPDDGTDANKVLIFGDMSAYIIAERQQISMRVANERYIDTDQTGFFLFERVGGALWNPDAIRFGIV